MTISTKDGAKLLSIFADLVKNAVAFSPHVDGFMLYDADQNPKCVLTEDTLRELYAQALPDLTESQRLAGEHSETPTSEVLVNAVHELRNLALPLSTKPESTAVADRLFALADKLRGAMHQRMSNASQVTLTIAFDYSLFDEGGEDRNCPRNVAELVQEIDRWLSVHDGTLGGGRVTVVRSEIKS